MIENLSLQRIKESDPLLTLVDPLLLDLDPLILWPLDPAEQGTIKREGGVTQIIVPNRNQFEAPEYIDSIEVKK